MKKLQRIAVWTGCLLLLSVAASAQDQWPKSLNASDGSLIRIYEPEPESFQGNVLKGRAAFSILTKGATEPVFGTFWAVANVETDRDNRMVHIVSVKVPNLKLAHDSTNIKVDFLKTELEAGIPTLNIDLSLDALLASLDMGTQEQSLSKDLNTAPPKVIYQTKPSLLVLIDGQPILKPNRDWGVDAVVNSPYTIVRNTDGQFYLYGAKHWYAAASATGPYSLLTAVQPNLQKVQQSVDAADEANSEYEDSAAAVDTAVSNIIVSTEPAELIQSNGDPVFTPIAGTGLSYISNSNNDIFKDGSGQYYILLSGRWYTSGSLQGSWQYVASDHLPADFARIPEGSPKDNVLASIAGTNAAREAIMDAQIPQTAMVDRKNGQDNVSVTYDGKPAFEEIPGTHMQYAVNSPNTVLKYKDRYYLVDNGVWFESKHPTDDWKVCTERPDEVDLIPPSSPVYNVKYVYIYDVEPDWVYMGYTPGYLDTYIYGPTVVYGTGFYYNPWRGAFFYPRPWTWGFNMWYNPWLGWTFGFDYGWDWFNYGFGFGVGFGAGLWFGGWWGPGIYRPAYVGRGFDHRGFYGRESYLGRNRFNYNNNIYRDRQDIAGREFQGRVTSDRDGNVFRRNAQGSWEQRQGGTWRSVNNNSQRQNLDRQEQQHDRGMMRTQNSQMARGGFFGGARGGGFRGGGFRGGGGGFRGGRR
jgi:hypothetical protein